MITQTTPCPEPAELRKRGRPRELSPEAREAAILDATARLLRANGLADATMDAIAAEAGMSKRTLYDVFQSRAALFEALIRHIRTTFVRPLKPAERTLPIAERLRLMFGPDGSAADRDVPMTVLRAVVAEARTHPDIGAVFLREGPWDARRIVREELEHANANDGLRIVDSELAARMLLDMVFESPVDGLVDPTHTPPSPAAREARLTLAIRTFVTANLPPCAEE